jgi:hypothetical protein
MKAVFRAALVVIGLGAAMATAQAGEYHTPAQNYYQNNWMGGGG